MKPGVCVRAAVILATAWIAGTTAARAEDYPTRPITVIVPFPAGGASDVVARIITNRMSDILGQSIVIENLAGAGGTLGSARAAASAPRRLHPAGGGDGLACCGTGADAERQVRSRERFHTDRCHRRFARGGDRAQGFPGAGF